MLAEIKRFIKDNQEEIILGVAIILVCLFCFAIGYLTAKNQLKEPLKFEETGLLF